ncbi:MAG TPA: LpqB family beta-propeller domain-containing protein [Thermoleophilaceae bacterium]|nr:LpqB family beta-propeller domain-containing protein [Thermoleophilaceae bacterium]
MTRPSRLKAGVAVVAAGAAAAVAIAPWQAPAAFPGANGRIAFQTSRDGNLEIYSMRQDGSSVRRLTDNDVADRNPSYAASGHLIAFERGSEEGPDIYLMAADGSGRTRIARQGGQPAWSPDGRRIAFRSGRDGNAEIYVMDADGTDVRRLTNHPAEDAKPAWSPDGTRIAFHTLRDGPTREIYVMDPDGSDQARLTNNAVHDLEPAWSPDGTRIAFQRVLPNTGADIGVMNADGTAPARLTTDPAEDRAPAWSPDGTRIAFTSARDGNAEVYSMNADGSGQTNLSANAAFDSQPDWAVVPGEKTLADLPPPVVGETANVDPSGRVLFGVRRRGRAAGAAQKGVRFVALREARQIPVGSFVNTRRGRIRLQSAGKSASSRQTGTFSGGLFQVLQSRRGSTKGLTSLRLKGSSFRRCGKGSSRHARAASHIRRRLRSRARGRFRTRGRHSAATVRGTTWVTVDRCDGTLTAVRQGRVVVRDFRRRRSILVRAGKSYLARR